MPLPLLLFALLAVIGPLSEDQREILATAHDGRDHREPAFFALVEHVRTWPNDPGDVAVRLDPDLGVILEHPADNRGALCLLAGRLEQRDSLPPPYDVAEEWFLRDPTNRAVLVYVVGLDETPLVSVGERFEVLARFYKRVDATARDGQMRSYPAFVGAHPRRVGVQGPADRSVVHFVIMLAAVGGLLIVFLFVLFRTRSARGRPRRTMPVQFGIEQPLDEIDALPDDPASALQELRRRSECDD